MRLRLKHDGAVPSGSTMFNEVRYNKTLDELLEVVNKNKTNLIESVYLAINLMNCIGRSIRTDAPSSYEDLEKEYRKLPSIGAALILQAKATSDIVEILCGAKNLSTRQMVSSLVGEEVLPKGE